MAENDNDEYQFTGLDDLTPGEDNSVENEKKDEGEGIEQKPYFSDQPSESNVKTRAIIVVSVFIALLVIYKFAGVFFGKKSEEIQTTVPSIATNVVEEKKQPITPVIPVTPVQPVVTQQTSTTQQQIEQKISALQLVQGNMSNELGGVGTQLNGINNNLSNLSAQLTELQQTISNLNDKLQQQSQEIARLKMQGIKKVHKPIVRRGVKGVTYEVQAVIPGRAWLIGSNGTTITVSEGSRISGYGIVKLIDANQGRVVMSSGKVLRFSQATY